MRLIYSPGACSISIHLVLEELGVYFDTQQILARRGEAQSETFREINPKGKVPVLILDDGTVLTETPVILQYLAEIYPKHGLLPAGTATKYEVLQLCEYLSNNVHNFGLTRIFRPQLFCKSEDNWEVIRAEGTKVLLDAFDIIASMFRANFMFGAFSIADASLFFFELHARRLHIAMPAILEAHLDRLIERPSIRRTIRREGLASAEFRIGILPRARRDPA